MLKFESEPTEIVELPVIVVDNIVKLISPEFKLLDDATLRGFAFTMGGELIYLKVRSTYTSVENMICTHKNCWRVAVNETLKCGDHK